MYHIQPKDTLKLQLPFFSLCVCVCVCMCWPLKWNLLLKHKVVPMIMLYSPFWCCCINTSHQCGKLKFNFVSLLYVSDIPLHFNIKDFPIKKISPNIPATNGTGTMQPTNAF